MIKVKVLSGQYAGQTRVVPPNVSARDLLGDFIAKRITWSIDYENATSEESFEWGRQDMACRILRALRAGLPVVFREEVYQLRDIADFDQLAELVGRVEDAVADSGRVVALGYDDERGVLIQDVGPIQ